MNASILESGRRVPQIPFEVRALLSALQLSKPDAAPLRKLSDEEWTRLLAFCDIAHLTLPVARLSMEGFPDWTVERLRTNLADNTLRFERVKATYREAAEAIEQAGIEHLVIKGFTQLPDYVPEPRFRAESDIDIFCLPKDIDAANSILQAIGYKPSGIGISYARADHVETLVRLGDWRWKGNPFDPEMPLGIELHFCLWNERVLQIRIPETRLFWERRTKRTVDGLSFSCLSPVDHLGYLALHIVRNLFLGDWIVHHVRELAVFLHSHADNETFWQAWNESHSPSLRSLEAIAFYYARAWFACRLHPLAADEIDRLSATRRSLLNYFYVSALELMFQHNKDSLWLHLAFLSSRREKWMILKQRLIPAHVGSIHSPSVQVRNRRIVQSRDRPLWWQYTAYVFSRFAAHGRANISTLTRFLKWRHFRHSLAQNLAMDSHMRD
jgi:hypothetical protein